jgi:hypothetical protein
MQLSVAKRSLLDARLASGMQLTEKLGRPPTLVELTEHWGTSASRTSQVLARIRGFGLNLLTAESPKSANQVNKQIVRKAEVEQLVKNLGRIPTLRELAKRWGVSRARAGQIMRIISTTTARTPLS